MPKTQPEFLVPRVSCALSLTVWLVLELFEMSIDIKSHVRPHPLGTGLAPVLVLGRFRSRPAIYLRCCVLDHGGRYPGGRRGRRADVSIGERARCVTAPDASAFNGPPPANVSVYIVKNPR